jgi:hypothetical protein
LSLPQAGNQSQKPKKRMNGKVITKDEIKHALHTKIGMGSTPDGVEVLPIQTAFEHAVEQMLLNALRDLQQSGEL